MRNYGVIEKLLNKFPIRKIKGGTLATALPFVIVAATLYANAALLFPSPIIVAAEAGDTPEVAKLITCGADIEAKNGTGMTPLMRAAEFGHTDTVQYLLAHGAKIDARDMSGFTALQVASSPEGHADTVDLLLRSGANPNVTDNDGCTALIWASAYGNSATVKVLIDHHSEVNIRDHCGETALDMAYGDKREMTANVGNAGSAKFLRLAGAIL